jgi:hypothetical protein
VVEHFLGKEEVKGSIPFNGSGFSGIIKSDSLFLFYRKAEENKSEIELKMIK